MSGLPVQAILRMPADAPVRRKIVQQHCRDLLTEVRHTCVCGTVYVGQGVPVPFVWYDHRVHSGPQRRFCRKRACGAVLP